MLREFNHEDKEQLVKIVKQGIAIIGQDKIDLITGKADKIVVYDDNETGLLGFCSLKRWEIDKKIAEVVIYVAPSSRRKGIGTLLYNEIIEHADKLNLNRIDTAFIVDKDDTTLFYKNLGYKKWYGMHDMHYSGSVQPESDMEFVPYEDKYFEQYVEGLRTSFYEMRRVHDFQPYLCCEFSEKKREELKKCKKNIFLLLIDGNAAAAVKISNSGSLGPIFVVPAYQGKGYGRIVTQFGINEAIRRGFKDINFEVIEWNVRARDLYLGLGFDIVQTIYYYRLYNKA